MTTTNVILIARKYKRSGAVENGASVSTVIHSDTNVPTRVEFLYTDTNGTGEMWEFSTFCPEKRRKEADIITSNLIFISERMKHAYVVRTSRRICFVFLIWLRILETRVAEVLCPEWLHIETRAPLTTMTIFYDGRRDYAAAISAVFVVQLSKDRIFLCATTAAVCISQILYQWRLRRRDQECIDCVYARAHVIGRTSVKHLINYRMLLRRSSCVWART